jgi:hypothetical protein
MNASDRPNTCKSREKVAIPQTGARVRNAYATYLLLGDSFRKRKLIPHNTTTSPDDVVKAPAVKDGHA